MVRILSDYDHFHVCKGAGIEGGEYLSSRRIHMPRSIVFRTYAVGELCEPVAAESVRKPFFPLWVDSYVHIG